MIDVTFGLLFIGFAHLAGQKRHPNVTFTFLLLALVFATFALATTEGWI